MHDPRNLANKIIEAGNKRDDPFSHLQIQKLMYYCHGWMLALYDRPLIDQDFEAWRYGPVEPTVYYSLSQHRSSPIRGLIPIYEGDNLPLDNDEQVVLNGVLRVYGDYSGMELSAKTHASGTPWHICKNRGKRYIPDDLMKNYFRRVSKRP